MRNKKVRMKLLEHDLKQWELAKIMGVSEATVYRLLRDELSEEKQDQIVKLIERGKENEE